MLSLNIVNREVPGKVCAGLCKNHNQVTGESAAASVWHKEIFCVEIATRMSNSEGEQQASNVPRRTKCTNWLQS